MMCLLILGAGAAGCCLGVVVSACCAAARAEPGPLVGRAAAHPRPDVGVRPLVYDRDIMLYTGAKEEEHHE